MWTSEITSQALRWAVCLLFAVAAALVGHRAFQLPALPQVRLGEKGRQRIQWLERASVHHELDALLRRVGAWVVVWVPREWLDSMERSLRRAGHPAGWTAAERIAALLLGETASLALAAQWWSSIGFSWVVPVLAAGPFAWSWLELRTARENRVVAIERSLPVAMDLVALCVRAGGDFPGALDFVVRELSSAHAVCRHELSQVLEALALGRTREQALEALAERVDSPPVREFVASLIQSERRGIPLCESLAVQSQTLRRARSVRAEEMAARAGVRMVLPLLMTVGCILCLLLGPMVIQGVTL